MRYMRSSLAKTMCAGVFLAIAAVFLSMLLASCAGEATPAKPAASDKSTASHASAQAGDTALPALDGEYSYVLAKVLAKDAEADSLDVEVVAWEDERPFVKSNLAVGATGTVSCSELVFFPAGIGDGSTVVVCCLSTDAGDFPLTAYAIEKLDLFEERVARWAAA